MSSEQPDLIQIENGSLLVAEPFMLDPNFKRAVVLIVDYSPTEGSIGFILNRSTPLKLSELIEDIDDFDAPVFYGGPVAENTLHFLHNVGSLIEESVKIAPGVYWGGHFESLKFLINQKLIQLENIRFFMGYSGWDSQQLQQEIQEPSWFIDQIDPNYIFKSKPEHLWKEILEKKGDHYSAISQMDGDYIFN